MKQYYRIGECAKGTFDLYEKGFFRGYYCGFPDLHNVFSVIPGKTLYLYAPPYSWKTWFKYEILLNLSKYYGWKHAICDPETGSKEDIVAYLTEMVVGKDYHNTYKNQMTEMDRGKAEAWLDEHFFIIDTETEDVSLKGFYEECEKLEEELNIKLNTTSIDPWDDIAHIGSEFSGSPGTQEYTTSALRYVRKMAKKNQWYNILVTHIRDQQIVIKGDFRFYPECKPREIAHGQAWFRKGLTMLGLWRPPAGMEVEGHIYEKNEVHVLPHKLKPNGVGEQGVEHKNVQFYVDFQKHRFYQKSGMAHQYALDPDKVKVNNPETDEVTTPYVPIEPDEAPWE